jgi:hypothetical protein
MRETERDGGEGRKTREAKGATPSSAVTTKPTKKTPRRAPKAEPNPVNTLVRHQSANLSFEPNPEPNRAQRNKSRAPKQLVRYIRDLETSASARLRGPQTVCTAEGNGETSEAKWPTEKRSYAATEQVVHITWSSRLGSCVETVHVERSEAQQRDRPPGGTVDRKLPDPSHD